MAAATTVWQFWQHEKSGEVFAVKVTNDEVTGVCGPLHHDEVIEVLLPDFHYEIEDIDWILGEPTSLAGGWS
jgi:hypothetical protein